MTQSSSAVRGGSPEGDSTPPSGQTVQFTPARNPSPQPSTAPPPSATAPMVVKPKRGGARRFILMVAICALEILVAGIQAYVFALLTSLYLNDAENLH